MTRTLTLLATLAVTAMSAVPASAYTPNPDQVYRIKKPFPCLRCTGVATPGSRFINPGDKVSLNPQPLPPKVFRPGDWVSLNPQPLPPKVYGKIVR